MRQKIKEALIFTFLLVGLAGVVFNFFGGEASGLLETSPPGARYLAKVGEIQIFPPPPKVIVLAVGDIMLDRGVKWSVEKNGADNFAFLFANLPNFKNDADILLGNLEGPVATGGSNVGSIYSFRMLPAVLPALKSAGFDVFNLANNHACDWGLSAFTETLTNLTQNNLAYVGGGLNYASATNPIVIEKNNFKIGFLGFSDLGPAGLRAGAGRPGILLANDSNFSQIIFDASRQVDVLAVSIHFGDEYQTGHNSRQTELARLAIDSGAKVIIGHHPHVIQDDEWYNGGYIAYSLGNFIFDQNFSTETMQGLALRLELSQGGVVDVQKKIIKLNEKFQPSFLAETN